MINSNEQVASVATVPVAGPQTAIPAVSKRKASLAVKAKSRALKVNLASRGRLPASVPVEHLDEDTLLSDVTRMAQDAFNGEVNLTAAVKACCEVDIEREKVVDAVVAAGWSDAWAKSRVSAIYCAAGKRLNKKGQGRPVPRLAITFADYMMEKTDCLDMAIKQARAALRYLVAVKKNKPVESDPAPAPVAK